MNKGQRWENKSENERVMVNNYEIKADNKGKQFKVKANGEKKGQRWDN